MTPGQTAAKQSLTQLEEQFAQYRQHEKDEIEGLRYVLRNLIRKYGSSAELAIIASSFEVAINRGE